MISSPIFVFVTSTLHKNQFEINLFHLKLRNKVKKFERFQFDFITLHRNVKTLRINVAEGKMARALPVEEFELCYRVDFHTVIRGYHVYKKVWNGCCTEQLYCKHDTREEALENDKRAIGVYKLNSSALVGHLPTELSSLIHFFLMDNADNRVLCNVIGKRYRELGLVLPATFKALTKHFNS